MNQKKNYLRYLLSVLFLLFIFLGLWLDLPNIKTSIRDNLSYFREFRFKEGCTAFETELNDSFFCKLQAVDVDGLFRRALGQKMVRNTVLDGDGQLHGAGNLAHEPGQWDRATEDRGIAYTRRLIDAARETGAAVVFVQTPIKCVPGTTPVPYGLQSIEWEIADYWLERLDQPGMCPILDLRDSSYGADRFFKTDHHWTIESAFAANTAILEAIHQQQPLEGLDVITDLENYEVDRYPDALLGSFGVRTGKYFVGKDDLSIPVPLYPMDVTFSAYDMEHALLAQYAGDFRTAFLDEKILNDPGYYNKYGAFLHSQCIENVVLNGEAFNDRKALLIGNSFTRPLTCYMSPAFSELRTLDVQTARYHGDAEAYIRDYDPDVVVIVYSIGFSQVG